MENWFCEVLKLGYSDFFYHLINCWTWWLSRNAKKRGKEGRLKKKNRVRIMSKKTLPNYRKIGIRDVEARKERNQLTLNFSWFWFCHTRFSDFFNHFIVELERERYLARVFRNFHKYFHASLYFLVTIGFDVTLPVIYIL